MRCRDSGLLTKGMSRERNSEKWRYQEKRLSTESDVKSIKGCQEKRRQGKPGSRESGDIRKGCQEKEMPIRKKRPDKEVARARVARREDVKRKRRQWI